jgi:hypothetical protein
MHSMPRSPEALVRRAFRGFVVAGVCAVLLAAAGAIPARAQQSSAVNPARITQVVDDSALTPLKGNVHPLARPQYDKGPADPSLPAERMQLVLQRSSGQEMALRQFLGSVQDKNSAQYRKWLTPEEFGAQYGVSDADVQTISVWLASQGLKANKVNKAHTILEFSGSIGQLQSAFHTQIHSFAVNGEQHLANTSDPQIPTALTPVVAGVAMNDFFPRPQHTKSLPGKYEKATNKFTPELTVGSASEGYFLYVGPGDAATIYDTPNALNTNFPTGGTSYTGSGLTIGIVGYSDIDLAPIANYRSFFGLPAQAPTVVVDGNDPGVNGAEDEAYIDLEFSGALAPGASQIYYVAASTNLDDGLTLAINRALDDNAASILSVSYGTCEAFNGASNNALFYSLWEQAASQGISVTVASDDSGSAGCDDPDTQTQAQSGLQVNGLASTPYNIAVGGTDFDVLDTSTGFTTYVSTDETLLTTALSFIPEEPWNNSPVANGLLSANTPYLDGNGDGNIVAAGGGASGCVNSQIDNQGNVTCAVYGGGTATGYPKPSWQTGGTLSIPDDGVRDLPDLSLFAANGAYGATWLTCTDDTYGDITTNCASVDGSVYFAGFGGTSTSTPAFAGILALVSQSQGGARLGQANYVLYNLANQGTLYSSVFHDTTVGNNSVYCVTGSLNCGSNLFETGYNTGVAYDQASGLGSVDVTQLVDDWNKATFASSTTTFTINGGTTPVSITHGQAVTLSATVAGASGTPTGDIAVVSNANQQANTYNSNWVNTYSLVAGTTGPQSFTSLPGGTYTVSANYGGDITFAQSQSTPGIQVTVAKENSVLEVFGANGSGSPMTISGSYPYGTGFSVDAQPLGVSQVGTPNPAPATGTVTFADTAGPLPGSSSGAAAGVVAINSFGYAELPVYYWTPAAHSVSASYSGDNSLNASSAATPTAFSITKAATSNTVSSSAATVAGGTFTVTSLITPNPLSSATAPSGTVTLTTNGNTIGTGTVQPIQEANTGASLATIAIIVPASSLAAGANTITAAYSGDGNYAASSGTVAVSSSAGFVISGTSIATLQAGSSGTSTVTITPSAGFTGAVNLTCAVTGPTGAVSVPTCAYNPASVTLATAAVTSTLTVTTTSTTTDAQYNVTLTGTDAATGKITATSTLPVTVTGFVLTSTAATVSSPGQSGTSTITITPNNYTGTIGLGCVIVSSPGGVNGVDNPTCTVSPNTETISGPAPVTVTATIATTAPAGTSALAYPKTNRWSNRWSAAADGAALACILLFGIPARRRGWRSMLGLLFVVSALAGIGCGGGTVISPNKPAVPGTTPGVYTFSVLGTDTVTATTTANTTFTVTVQ